MSIATENLGLRTPELTDDPRQVFINDMEHNNELLDEKIIDDYSVIPYKSYKRDKKIFYKNRVVGDYVGAINIRAGEYTPTWSGVKYFTIGDKISPTVNNGHFYICTKTGYSAPNEPSWSLASNSITEDSKNKEVWQPNKFYSINQIVVPTINNDMYYLCTTSGTSGASEPTWSIEGSSTVDNQVVWLGYRIVRWQEAGVSANFRPFGKIE